MDLKSSLGYLKREGTLYDSDSKPWKEELDELWHNDRVLIEEEEPAVKPEFIKALDECGTAGKPLDLESQVNSWVDYLVPRFHYRTVNVVNAYNYGSTSQPFETYTYGRTLWATEQFSDDFQNRIRNYVEECDLMQGFQVILDSTDGFAGLGTSCIQYLYDEYGKSILTFPCIDSQPTEPSKSDLVKAINTTLCWQHLGESASLYSPLCCGNRGWLQPGDARVFEHVDFDRALPYHSSAILATALDTLSIRYRRKEYPNAVLSDLCADLNRFGRKGVATSLSLPFPMKLKMDLIDVLDEFDGPLWTSLTPSCEIPMDRNAQSICLRGIPEDRLKRPMQDAIKQMSMPAYKCSTVHEMMTLYLACNCHASATYLANIKTPLKIEDPYPRIFTKTVSETGEIGVSPIATHVDSVPVMGGLHSGNTLSAMYESLHKQVSKVRSINKFHAFRDSGLEEDEFKESLDHLLDCKESFEDSYI